MRRWSEWPTSVGYSLVGVVAFVLGYGLEDHRSSVRTEWPLWLAAMCLAGAATAVRRLRFEPPDVKKAFTLGFVLRLCADLGSLTMLLGQPATRLPDVMPPIPIIVFEFVVVAAIHGAIAAAVAKGLATFVRKSAHRTR